ncbi:MAG: hypothetical protein HPKKFMNG_01784 [Planctomycetes bacterium]|nr:hypothetical protein [Planctomycetota bacterium]MCQ3949329.1 hypothetical protein [Planctomycetota bacterium]GIK53555.1 MAG: type VI secretion system protein ImpK [Planctomycetota bacterium]
MLSTFISVKTRLPDLCTEVWNYALELRRGGDPGRAEAVKSKVSSLFRLLDKQAKLAQVDQADLQQAKYALCAQIDEIVMSSAWPCRGGWAPLCVDYYGDGAAGENFYQRLETYRHSSETRRRDLLEVFYICLALGFLGRFSDTRGLEQRKALMDGISRELCGEAARPLSVQVTSPDPLPKPRSPRPFWLVPALCLLAVGALYAALSWALGTAA